MIHYILCDRKILFREKMVAIIDKSMMKNDMQYEKHIFDNYNDQLIKIINKKMACKIYILDLDLETDGKSGFEVAKMIRKFDIDSILIFCTENYKKYQEDILKSKFQFLAFIDKNSNWEQELEETIVLALKNMSMKSMIRFKCKNIVYTIATMDILYIKREKDRKCTIQTSDHKYVVSKPLVKFEKMLDDRFVYSYRSCIVNYDRIAQFNRKNKTILFDNNMGIDLVSSRFKMKDE